ncbi:hypothetical protein JCM19238_3899 [Vibrio ponticus]|nr:hypothetical protein JCM19238_3899 [Vibrio ponticus]
MGAADVVPAYQAAQSLLLQAFMTRYWKAFVALTKPAGHLETRRF